jgi:hypothetical protein
MLHILMLFVTLSRMFFMQSTWYFYPCIIINYIEWDCYWLFQFYVQNLVLVYHMTRYSRRNWLGQYAML